MRWTVHVVVEDPRGATSIWTSLLLCDEANARDTTVRYDR